jgi:hypothetical protein
MTQEFIPGVWYPIEMKDMLPHSVAVTIAKLDTAKFQRRSDVTHFKVNKRTVIESPKPELPNVPEFILSYGIEENDTFINQDGDRYTFKRYFGDPIYPIRTATEGAPLTLGWTRRGWNKFEREGNRIAVHIIRIERNGVTVAEGQVYDE